MATVQTWVSVSKDIANIGFFVVVAVVTILTYRRARETIFMPLKTEIFKIQLKEIGEVFALLREIERDERCFFDLPLIVDVNTMKMFDAYVDRVLDGKLRRPETYEKEAAALIAGAVSTEAAFRALHTYPTPRRNPQTQERPKPPWRDYTHLAVDFTHKFAKRRVELEHLSESPFLPDALRGVLREIEAIAGQNLHEVGEFLTAAAVDLPLHYQTAEEVRQVDLSYFWNGFNERSKSTLTSVKDGMSLIRRYLAANDLLARDLPAPRPTTAERVAGVTFAGGTVKGAPSRSRAK